MNKLHSLDRVLSMALKPWAITAPMLSVIGHVLGHHLAGETPDLAAFERRPPAESSGEGGVAILPIHGVLAPRMTMLGEMSGGTSYDQVGQMLNVVMARKDISTIVLDIDSPGGSVQGVGELASKLRAARETKKIIAHANYEMCSAAYWLGASCSEIVAAPSAMVGSIGVYTIHKDLSAALEKHGVKLTYISAGKYKVDGNEAEPLSESAHAHVKALVDATYEKFLAGVAAGRHVGISDVRGGYGEGTSVSADQALTLGMIDRIETLEDTVGRALPSGARLARMDATATLPAHESAPVPVDSAGLVPRSPHLATRALGARILDTEELTMLNLISLEKELRAKAEEGTALLKETMQKAEDEGRAMTDDEYAAIEAISKQGLAIQAKIDRLKGVDGLRDQLVKLAGSGATEAALAARPGQIDRRSMGEQFVQSEQYRGFFGSGAHRTSASWRSPSVELFDRTRGLHATTLTTDPASGGDLIVPQYLPGILPLQFKKLTVADLLASGTTDSNLISYMVETLFTNAAAPVAEGALKPESAMVFDLLSEAVRKIAHWLPVTEEMLEDVSQIRSYIDARLRLGVEIAEEDQLLNGTGDRAEHPRPDESPGPEGAARPRRPGDECRRAAHPGAGDLRHLVHHADRLHPEPGELGDDPAVEGRHRQLLRRRARSRRSRPRPSGACQSS